MASYTTLRKGSSGQEVKELQNALINKGYDLGSGGADGIYGSQTDAAVRKYQRDNSLVEDGVAGNQTLGSLYGGASGSGSTLTGYEQAKQLLEEHMGTKPGEFAWADQGLLDEARDKWLNCPDFQYDLSKDPFYQQYRDQYINQGQLAMLDTMGQAAALTGGYGSTYAQTAGQQAYQGYLQQLNDVAPELYSAAYDRYNAEGEALYNQLALLDAQRQQAYGEHQDNVNEWYSYLSHLNDNVQYEQQLEYQRERDAIADAQWQQEYNLSAARAYSGGDESDEEDGYVGTPVAGSGSLSKENIKMIQWSLGIETTGVWDQATIDASGYKNSNDCYNDWINGKVVNGQEWTSYYASKLSAAQRLKTQLQGKSAAEKESAIMQAWSSGQIDDVLAKELISTMGIQ